MPSKIWSTEPYFSSVIHSTKLTNQSLKISRKSKFFQHPLTFRTTTTTITSKEKDDIAHCENKVGFSHHSLPRFNLRSNCKTTQGCERQETTKTQNSEKSCSQPNNCNSRNKAEDKTHQKKGFGRGDFIHQPGRCEPRQSKNFNRPTAERYTSTTKPRRGN